MVLTPDPDGQVVAVPVPLWTLIRGVKVMRNLLSNLWNDGMQRHRVKPGITGWAQVNGYRGEAADIEKMRKRVSFDFYYIDNWSLWFDMKIIVLTILRGFRDENAY